MGPTQSSKCLRNGLKIVGETGRSRFARYHQGVAGYSVRSAAMLDVHAKSRLGRRPVVDFSFDFILVPVVCTHTKSLSAASFLPPGG